MFDFTVGDIIRLSDESVAYFVFGEDYKKRNWEGKRFENFKVRRWKVLELNQYNMLLERIGLKHIKRELWSTQWKFTKA
jgi:hypothetical protein